IATGRATLVPRPGGGGVVRVDLLQPVRALSAPEPAFRNRRRAREPDDLAGPRGPLAHGGGDQPRRPGRRQPGAVAARAVDGGLADPDHGQDRVADCECDPVLAGLMALVAGTAVRPGAGTAGNPPAFSARRFLHADAGRRQFRTRRPGAS